MEGDEDGEAAKKIKQYEASKIAADEAAKLQRNSNIDVFASLEELTVSIVLLFNI